MICQGEIRPNTEKVQALTMLTSPETVTQLRQFIGLTFLFFPNTGVIVCAYYRYRQNHLDP